ncbi:hypothetical protein HYN59_15260 [Flavobacterium album]|uniref:Gliding motility-associated protein GldM N-terminal domain-containing protein n=1 Tax=Flavobacterium album TaxID=2175091 RepID=A0A2S1R104_9FLAO|nr:hypothetical protein [Flavobacterium album]AWH86383.1 hypothetical protein HYN59_15260 [Flavobacterium album]
MLRLKLRLLRLTGLVLAVMVLPGCNGAGDTQIRTSAIRDTVPAIKISSQYRDFEREADSTLCRLDSLLTLVDIQTADPGRRRHMAARRRQFIKAQYQLDKLRGRLKGHSDAYRDAVQHLERTEHDNPAFIKDYREALQALASTIAVLGNDTLP